MPTMIQPPNDRELFFDEMNIWEDVTKEHFEYLQHLQLMQDMQ